MAIHPPHATDDVEGQAGVQPRPAHALPAGTRLRDYEITGLIGEGGFGIVYLAFDHSLQRKVAIKEYMPASMASRVAGASAIVVKSERQLDPFQAGLKSFVNEARLLARFDHPSLVRVYRFWEENGTAYMVMPLYEGPTLQTALAELGHVPSEAELRAWLKPVLDAVSILHAGQTWHQNIGPDTILLTPTGPVLLGLGSARQAIATAHHAPVAALRPGFAAIEQYGSVADTNRGACTDLYALAAVVALAITGVEPPPAISRLVDDQFRPLSVVAAGLYSVGFLAAIDAALAVQPELRPSDHLQFRALMGDIDAPERVVLMPRRDLMQEPFAGAPEDGPREVTVPDRPPLPVQKGGDADAAAVATSRTARAAATPRAKARRAATPDRDERGAPTFIQPGAARAALGKRAVYGLVACSFAAIGLAALGIQFHARQAGHVAIADAAKPSPPAPAASAASVSAVAVTPASSAVTTIAAAETPSPAPATAASSAIVVPASIAATLVPVAVAVAASATRPYPAPPATDAERQARCVEILQKASLEQITSAETLFFKKECK